MITIRRASIDDADTVTDIVCTTWLDSYKDMLSEDVIRKGSDYERKLAIEKEILSDNSCAVFLALDGTQPSGMATVDSSGYIRQLYVRKHCQGMGVGTMLLDALTAAAKDFGCTRLTLDTLESSRQSNGFYRKNGFAAVSKEQPDFLCGAVSIKYEKDLTV